VDPKLLEHGTFTLQDDPWDVPRAMYAMFGFAGVYLSLMGAMATVALIRAVTNGQEPPGFAVYLVLAWSAFLAVTAFAMWKVHTSPDRVVKLRVTEHALSAFRSAGDVALRWDAIKTVTERGGILILTGHNLRMILPLYRMSEAQIDCIRARLSEVRDVKQTGHSRSTRWVALFVILLLAFLAVYYFVASTAHKP
jgi:hypothetical protein